MEINAKTITTKEELLNLIKEGVNPLEYIKEDKHKCLSFNNKIIIDRKYDAPEIFKLLVDDKNNVVDVKNIVLEAN